MDRRAETLAQEIVRLSPTTLARLCEPRLLERELTGIIARDLTFLFGSAFRATWQALVETTVPHDASASRIRRFGDEFTARESSDDTSATMQLFAIGPFLRNRAGRLRSFYGRFLRELDAASLADPLPEYTWTSVAGLSGGLSDSHRGGRQVLIVSFTDGTRLVYKPRSLAPEAFWQRWCRAVNAKADRPLLGSARVWDRGSHGWMEYVPDRFDVLPPLALAAQTGCLLAAAHRLGATDVHRENVRFSAHGPLLIDCETVLSPGLDATRPRQCASFVPWWNEVADTVLSTSAVTGYVLKTDGAWRSIGVVSALLGHAGPGERASLLTALRGGYIECHTAIDRYVRSNGLARDLNCITELRFLARRTNAYARLLSESVAAASLRREGDRRRSISKLQEWPRRSGSALHKKMADAEAFDISSGDIPYFTINARSNELRSSSGENLGTAPGESAVARAGRKSGEFGAGAAEKQLAIIEMAVNPPVAATTDVGSVLLQPRHQGRFDEEVIALAGRYIDDCLSRHIVHDGRTVGLLGASFAPHNDLVTVAPLSQGLYSGLSGLALCYASHWKLTGDERLFRATSDIARAISHMYNADTTDLWNGFTGGVSDLYALWVAYQYVPSPNVEEALSLVDRYVSQARFEPESLGADVVGGAAGMALTLTALRGSGLSAADDGLLARVLRRLEGGILGGSGAETLSEMGMAHGRLGLVFSATRVAHALGAPQAAWHQRMLETGEKLFELCVKARSFAAVSWCRGLVGAAAALLDTERSTGERCPFADEVVAWILDHQDLVQGRSLCCGQAAVADVLASLRDRPGSGPQEPEPDLPPAGAALTRLLSQPQNPRLPSAVAYPGMMQGSAGVAYTLLRSTYAGRGLPSLLSCSPPVSEGP
ncbi:DUF4135 domain-containing protein [Allonocardiopsis opalescens]|uniref:Lantibiotic modifying enzyme n=1 Tax=Allonocardiopsis opalescens TaxID=1144618 RepID=A0A2T0Q119_9ACTN|nr:DUF4135 domain-containing protein [Allonocardiopsis opalescens]PRX97373.1 lantibiotic modifying enzyme [Allonocardiopsis opalescens]